MKTIQTTLPWIEALTPGDLVAVSTQVGYQRGVVEKLTPSQVVVRRKGFTLRYYRSSGREVGKTTHIHPLTFQIEEEIRSKEVTKEQQEERDRKQEADKRADPRYDLLQRFKTTDWEPWSSCTLEELQAIASILDKAKERSHEDQQASTLEA